MNDEHDEREQGGTSAPESVAIGSDAAARPAPTPRPMLVVCPYCGHESLNHSRCERCKGLMDPLSRQASQNAMGPWFVRDDSLPFRPGCSYDTLRSLIAKGRVTRESVLRGPSTRQFWTRATSVPGVAHLMGECHACHTGVAADCVRCPACAASFDCSRDRQGLGLAPVRLLPGHAAPEEIARSMMESLRNPSPVVRAEPVRGPRANEQSEPASDVPAVEHTRRRSGVRVVVVIMIVLLAFIAMGMLAAWLIAPEALEGWYRSLVGSK